MSSHHLDFTEKKIGAFQVVYDDNMFRVNVCWTNSGHPGIGPILYQLGLVRLLLSVEQYIRTIVFATKLYTEIIVWSACVFTYCSAVDKIILFYCF